MAKKELCFVIMPFHQDFDDLWKDIQKAGKRFKYLNIERSNTQDPGKKKVFKHIKEGIQRASFVIADISKDPKYDGYNPNVMLEVGYAMGMEKDMYFISRKPLLIPSDINQHSIIDYDPKIDDLDDWFESKIEKMMVAHQIETERVVQKRETQAEKLNWLIEVVKKLHNKVRDNYEGYFWKVDKKVYFQPKQHSFNLKYNDSSSPEESVTYEVSVGAFFSQWKRRDSPFKILVKIHENGNTTEESYNIPLEEPLETIPVEKIIDRYEEKLDELLRKFTPNLSTLTPLAHIMQTMEEVRSELSHFKVEGYTSLREKRMRMKEYLGHAKRTNRKWGKDGFRTEGFLESDNSQIVLSIDFDQWDNGGVDTPYWVRFNPYTTITSFDVRKWFKEAEEDGPTWNIPVIVQNKMDRNEILSSFERVVSTLVQKYQPFRSAVENTEEEENVDIEENLSAEEVAESIMESSE